MPDFWRNPAPLWDRTHARSCVCGRARVCEQAVTLGSTLHTLPNNQSQHVNLCCGYTYTFFPSPWLQMGGYDQRVGASDLCDK